MKCHETRLLWTQFQTLKWEEETLRLHHDLECFRNIRWVFLDLKSSSSNLQCFWHFMIFSENYLYYWYYCRDFIHNSIENFLPMLTVFFGPFFRSQMIFIFMHLLGTSAYANRTFSSMIFELMNFSNRWLHKCKSSQFALFTKFRIRF